METTTFGLYFGWFIFHAGRSGNSRSDPLRRYAAFIDATPNPALAAMGHIVKFNRLHVSTTKFPASTDERAKKVALILSPSHSTISLRVGISTLPPMSNPNPRSEREPPVGILNRMTNVYVSSGSRSRAIYAAGVLLNPK
jgi:hypothetical protein